MVTVAPRVSVCIPTYNRAPQLERALRSVLEQTYTNLEILVLDNASTDNTQDFLRGIVAEDDRVQFEVNNSNIGAANNFYKVIRQSTSDYCMWLADDDWLDSNYIQECMHQFLLDDSYCLISGGSEILFEGTRLLQGQHVNIGFESPLARLLMYYAWVGDNGIFYGIYKRGAVLSVVGDELLGSDWFFMAGIVFQGKVRTVDTTVIHRCGDGASADLKTLAKTLGHNPIVQREPYLGVAYGAFKDLLGKDHIYGQLNPVVRYAVALLLMVGIFVKKVILQKIYRFFRSIFRYVKKLHSREGKSAVG